jgi:hypothetical protein
MHSHPQHTDRQGRRLNLRGRSLISLLVAFLMACGLLTATAGPAAAAPPDVNRLATWNMQYGPDKWGDLYRLSANRDVVAVQEVPYGEAPDGAERQTDVNGVEHYIWRRGPRGHTRHLYILRTDSRNLGMVTTWVPDNVVAIPSVNRPALAALRNADDTVFASIHAESPSGNDGGALLRRIQQFADGNDTDNWVALGDWNRNPRTLPDLLPPSDSIIYNPGQPTHRDGGEYDYMVANYRTNNWQATVQPNTNSDHWPVTFNGTFDPNTGRLFPIEIHADNAEMTLLPQDGRQDNGTDIVQDEDENHETSRWRIITTGAGSGDTMLYRIVQPGGKKCLDVEGGQHSVDGSPLHLWDCHGNDIPGGPPQDPQNWILEHPDPMFPNLTVLRNVESGLVANVTAGSTFPGARVIQHALERDGAGRPVLHESFYLHPQTDEGAEPDPS